MDRSSMNKIETTQDVEKRQAFKAKLLNKIDSPQPKEELSIVDNTFNGVAPGGRLVHPSLGEGTLVEVDKAKNEVLIQFDHTGLIGLVLTQAKSFVHAPHGVETKIIDDPFVGEEITRPVLNRSDTAHRPVDFATDKIISPDFVDNEKPFLPEGSAVIHPSLGAGTLIKVDTSKNEALIDFVVGGPTTLVLSQVRSFLRVPGKSEVKLSEDAFFGDDIRGNDYIRPDVAQRKVDTSKVISPDFAGNKNYFFPEGSVVVHPSLGEGTIVKVDKNEVTVDFAIGGLTPLVLSQAQSVLKAPAKAEVKSSEDAFIGEKIVRDGPVRPDAVQRTIDTSKVVSPEFKEVPNSFFPVGSVVVHPSLGQGTIVKVEKNEVLVDFAVGGVTPLVLSQARAFLQVPTKAEVKAAEDAFVGEKIVRDGPIRHDTAQRKIDTSKVVSADFKESSNSFFPVGSVVVHPSLGEGTITKVEKNEVIVDFNVGGVTTLVLSQVRSVLRAPTKAEVKATEDAFIGEKIIRDGPVHPDVAQRKIDTSKVVSADFKDVPNSFFPIGSVVVHPSLGEGTITKVEKNEVIVDFTVGGLTPLVLSQAKSVLRAPTKEEIKASEDAFIGEKIIRDGPVRHDTAQRKIDTSKVISADFKDTPNSFFPVDSAVVHPSLGEGTIVKVEKNEVIVDFVAGGLTTLVLSQAQSVLRAPAKAEVKTPEDAFIGEKINRDGPVRPDVAQRALDTSKIVSPEFKESPNSFFPVGSVVVHPSLGQGTILKVEKNEVVVDFVVSGITPFILSQARTFLQVQVKDEVQPSEDAFIGEKILRDGPVRHDTAQRTIDTSKVVSADFKDSDIPLIPVGTKVFHKELGECTIISMDTESNEIVLDSNRHGFVNLVLSQVHPHLTPVADIRKQAREVEDAFIGEKINRDGPVRPDVAQRTLDTSKVVSADFVEPQKSFFSSGSSVWHPGLGACTVLSINEKNNSISLKTSSNEVVEMVLSQVRSKLREVATNPEHIPTKPLVRESLAPKVPQYTSRSDVFVLIPEVFKTWQRSQQFMYLTRSQKLTTEQANDVFSVLGGEKPLFHGITIKWQSQKDVEANILPGPEALSTVIDGARTFSGLQDKRLWHPDFGECSVSSIEGNQLVLMTSVGQVPCVLDVTVPKLAVLTAAAPEHAPKQLGTKTRVLATSDAPVTDRPVINVSLPEVFVNWRTVDQYQFLTGSRHLIPEHANDIIATMTGKLHSSKTEYVIEWTNELPETDKRAEYKRQLQAKVENVVAEPVAPAPKIIVVPGVKRWTEDVVTKKVAAMKKVEVDLPSDFNSWTSSGQYVFLTRTKQLTFNEANDVMDVLKGKTVSNNVQYEITWNGSPIVGTPGTQKIITEWAEETTMVESVLKKVEVILPAIFKNWASSGKFGYLTRTRQLTFDQANDVLAILDGKTPQNNKIKYEIVWE